MFRRAVDQEFLSLCRALGSAVQWLTDGRGCPLSLRRLFPTSTTFFLFLVPLHPGSAAPPPMRALDSWAQLCEDTRAGVCVRVAPACARNP